MSKRLTRAEFLAKAVAAHGSRYDYSQTVYVRAHDKVKITCAKHGEFSIKAYAHLAGNGCLLCGQDISKRSRLSNTDEFLSKAAAAHGKRYDYSLVEYRRVRDAIFIRCKQHGLFKQTPNMHLRGQGCPACAKISVSRKNRRISTRWSTESLRSRCKEMHPELDFSLLEYTGDRKPVVVICLAHGAYEVANFHNILQGNITCRKCRKEAAGSCPHWPGLKKGQGGTLYLIKLYNELEQFYKVGITCRTIQERFKKSRLGGYNYEILASFFSSDADLVFEWEQSILQTFKHLRYKPANLFEGWVECFSQCEPIMRVLPIQTKFH
jgi:hypothetical protein